MALKTVKDVIERLIGCYVEITDPFDTGWGCCGVVFSGVVTSVNDVPEKILKLNTGKLEPFGKGTGTIGLRIYVRIPNSSYLV